MNGIEITWTFAVLEALAFALVGAVEGELKAWGITAMPRLFLYARALLVAGAFVVSQLFPTPSNLALVELGALAMALGVLGYWPQVQQVGNRIKGQ